MKVAALAVAAGMSAPLIMGGSASGGFVGLKTVVKENPFGLLVINVYAVFDRPGEDHMIAVAGTPNAPLLIQVHNGTFFNANGGTDTAASAFFISLIPSLAFDTFVTIGIKFTEPLSDALVITPDFQVGITGTQLFLTNSGWTVTPVDAQGDPFDPAYVQGNGQVLIGQFATADGTSFSGTMLIQFISNGVPEQAQVCLPTLGGSCPCPGDCGNFDNDVGIVDFLALLAEWGQVGTPCDIDGSGFVTITDFLVLLGNWGPCLQQPTGTCCLPGDICEQLTLQSCNAGGGTWRLAGTSCDDFNGMSNICTGVCPWDCGDMDGIVDAVDFLNVLKQWNLVGTSCDIGLGNPAVGINDLLSLLANWGPCP